VPDQSAASCCICAGLTSLKLEDWGVQQLPASIGQLTNLRSLNIADCRFTSLPDSLVALTALTQLQLKACNVKQLPQGMGQLSQLKQLYIDRCGLLEALPASLAQLTGGVGQKNVEVPTSCVGLRGCWQQF
jgi:Leucine-rich repeat (LRR) protein